MTDVSPRRVARVLLDSPLPQLDRLFDYAIPADLTDDVVAGARVRVPLRTAGRVIDGFVVDVGVADPADRPLSDLDSLVSAVPVLPPRLYALARKVADRAAGSASDILRLVIPKRMVRAEKIALASPQPAVPEVAPDQIETATSIVGGFAGLADAIESGERIALDADPHLETLPGGTSIGAWAMLLAASAALTLSHGRSAVIVVPDHRDQAQVAAALAILAPAGAVVEVDARQSGPSRYSAYLRVLADAPCIVLGNRSAVYAPVADLGLLAVWDDGDPLLDEPLSPGVHARDAALVRQELEPTALLFAGHTRTTDIERLVSIGWLREISRERKRTPKIVLSAHREGESRGERVPSSAFLAARDAVREGPVLVQVARPGYAPSLVCAKCRHPARCSHCAGPLHAKRPGSVPTCSWCGRSAHAWACSDCGSDSFRMTSSGSERTADELGRAFAGTRIIVADGEHPVLRVDSRPALVVATRGAEPIAEGGYRAIVLLDGDRMLQADDLRIAESCLRWWSNAAALAAPGAPVHLVGVAGGVARALATWTQPAFARSELAERAPLRMPPTVRVAAMEGSQRSVDSALSSLRATIPQLEPTAVLGPVQTQTGARALVRFDYALGPRTTEALRAAVVADALSARKAAKGRPPAPRNTLRVRVDVPDLDL